MATRYKEFSELEIKIFEATIELFNSKGLKLTMDDLANHMGMSKKTIYATFDSKEALFNGMVDFIFDGIKRREEEILNKDDIDTMARIRCLLTAMPENYGTINFQDLAPLKEKFPKVYKKMQKRMETGWESTINLIEQGKQEGIIKPDVDIRVFKVMMEASLERFFETDILITDNISYMDALNEVVEILLTGISK